MILLIDNYDSFTYNLYHQIATTGEEVLVVRNDKMTIPEIQVLNPKAIIISPGPGTPEKAGMIIEMIQSLYKEIPILGICLGHQAIGHAFGATVSRATHIMHGKTSELNYVDQSLFAKLTGVVEVMRYHSLVIEKETLPNDFEVLATAKDDGEIMAIQHKTYPLYGLQFHPESIGTESGYELIQEFIENLEG